MQQSLESLEKFLKIKKFENKFIKTAPHSLSSYKKAN